MRAAKILLPFLLLLIVCGCGKRAGGGGIHVPPEVIYAGQPTMLEHRISVWGYEPAEIVKHFTEMHCHYRLSGESKFVEVAFMPGRVEENEVKEKEQVYTCTLPAFNTVGAKVEYYI